MIKNTYILCGNSSFVIIYSKKNNENNFNEIKRFNCLEGRMKNIDLVSDKAGRQSRDQMFRTSGLMSSYTKKDHFVDQFAKTVSDFVNASRCQRKYNDLVIASSPGFLGVLIRHFDKETLRSISKSINKDLSQKESLQRLRALV